MKTFVMLKRIVVVDYIKIRQNTIMFMIKSIVSILLYKSQNDIQYKNYLKII